MNEERIFEYKFSDNINDIVKLESIVDLLGKEWGIDENLQFSINVVLEELISNIVFYGFSKKNPKNEINIKISKQDNNILLIISDNAKKFNLLEQEEKDTNSKSLENMKVGGLGIHFVKKLTSFIKYKRKNKINYLTLSFILNK